MKLRRSSSFALLMGGIALMGPAVLYGGGDHGAASELDMSGMSLPPAEGAAGEHKGQHGHNAGHGAGHTHDRWLPAPDAYADKRLEDWSDFQAIKAGMKVYRENCLVCHGADGRGSGPLAKQLAHPPADLANHFHQAPGKGDAYLYWRVSEGGTAEPFRSAKSAMPAFEQALSEQQRWAVLVYVHNAFHGGFREDPEMSSASHPAARGGGHH